MAKPRNGRSKTRRSAFRQSGACGSSDGLSYLPLSAVVSLPIEHLCGRILTLEAAPPQQVEAALGGKEEPTLSVSKTLEKYWELARPKTMDKSDNQIRKWKNPRIKAVKNFIKVAGDKEVKAIAKTDTLALRDWWIGRIENEELKSKTANKDFIHLKEVLKTVSKHFGWKLKIKHLFHDLMFEEDTEQTRLPFTTEQIIALLQDDRLQDMDEDARWLITAMSETGARNTEIIGLLPEDIRLDVDIPHIAIVSRKKRKLKTKYSKRIIPLVGYALDAFVARPNGFPQYREHPDVLTNKANKFLREKGLFPSEKHSAYSLRHGFQDRLTAVNAGERVQTDLMGHRFNREKYGNGASLEQKKEWMDKICVKP